MKFLDYYVKRKHVIFRIAATTYVTKLRSRGCRAIGIMVAERNQNYLQSIFTVLGLKQ